MSLRAGRESFSQYVSKQPIYETNTKVIPIYFFVFHKICTALCYVNVTLGVPTFKKISPDLAG